MRDRDWPGMAALVLAVCLGVGWSTAIIVFATPWGPPIGPAESELMNGLGQVLAGALATFLGMAAGSNITRRARKSDDPDQ